MISVEMVIRRCSLAAPGNLRNENGVILIRTLNETTGEVPQPVRENPRMQSCDEARGHTEWRNSRHLSINSMGTKVAGIECDFTAILSLVEGEGLKPQKAQKTQN